jgi:hypothetical protein
VIDMLPFLSDGEHSYIPHWAEIAVLGIFFFLLGLLLISLFMIALPRGRLMALYGFLAAIAAAGIFLIPVTSPVSNYPREQPGSVQCNLDLAEAASRPYPPDELPPADRYCRRNARIHLVGIAGVSGLSLYFLHCSARNIRRRPLRSTAKNADSTEPAEV